LEYDKDRDGRFAPEEIPDPLAKRWIRLIDLDADGYLGQDEWAYYQAARSSQGGMWAFRLGGRGDMTEVSTTWHYDRAVPQLPSPLLYRASSTWSTIWTICATPRRPSPTGGCTSVLVGCCTPLDYVTRRIEGR
jgi:hypothetical protein